MEMIQFTRAKRKKILEMTLIKNNGQPVLKMYNTSLNNTKTELSQLKKTYHILGNTVNYVHSSLNRFRSLI